MFYSNTYLARKGPLGTVWIAAHLQHRLRKQIVEATNIPITVDYIMVPEVPIALRLSAHLLLGIVRIYSRKVDYLFTECNQVLTRLKTLCASIHDNINLPEDASCAPFHSITLPEKFELDALDFDDASNQERVLDHHTSTSEEITLTDCIPGEAEPYVTFFIEDIRADDLPAEENPDTGVRPMDEDASTSGVNSVRGDTVPASLQQLEELNHILFEDRFTEALPEIEVMRDAVNDFGTINDEQLLGFGNDVNEQQGPPQQAMNEKVNLSPIMEDMPTLGGQSLSPQRHSPPSVSALPETQENSNISASPAFVLGNNSLELAIQPTPPVEKQNPKSRKRKQAFDTSIVLSNQFMKEALNDPSGLVRKRNSLPFFALDVWKFHKRSRMDRVFLESSISGLCEELQNLSKKEFSKLHTVPVSDTNLNAGETVHTANTHQETTGTAPVEDSRGANFRTPMTESNTEVERTAPVEDSRGANFPTPVTECNTEVERFRFDGQQDPGSSLLGFTSSPFRGDEATPLPTPNINSEPPASSMMDTEPLPTLEHTISTQPINSDMETPMTRFDLGTVGSNLSDIPESMNRAEEEDLWFLEAENTPAAEQIENEEHALSARTRAVAQFLKDQSPTTVVSKDHTASLNLNEILDGKTRRKCGRMFFETLVLKSYGYIDVQQEEPYGDIMIQLDPLSNAKF